MLSVACTPTHPTIDGGWSVLPIKLLLFFFTLLPDSSNFGTAKKVMH